MIPFLLIGGIIAVAGIVVLTVSIFRDNIKAYLERNRLLSKGVKVNIKKICPKSNIKHIKIDVISQCDNSVILKNATYQIDSSVKIDDEIHEGVCITI